MVVCLYLHSRFHDFTISRFHEFMTFSQIHNSRTNSRLSHEFTTFSRFHDFCMSSYVEFHEFTTFSRIHDFLTISRLSHEFTNSRIHDFTISRFHDFVQHYNQNQSNFNQPNSRQRTNTQHPWFHTLLSSHLLLSWSRRNHYFLITNLCLGPHFTVWRQLGYNPSLYNKMQHQSSTAVHFHSHFVIWVALGEAVLGEGYPT